MRRGKPSPASFSRIPKWPEVSHAAARPVVDASLGQRLLFVLPADALPDFGDLLAAWRERGIHVTTLVNDGALPDVQNLLAGTDATDAVLLAGSSRRAPSTVLAGPFVTARTGRRVPVAWLPLTGRANNRRFAATAARVQRRAREQTAVAVLGQWQPRYLRVADRIEALLAPHLRTLRWTGDVLGRDDTVRSLGSGLGLAIYVGHGRPVGWVGYHGVRAHHFETAWADPAAHGEPLGAVLSLCCRTASRRRVGLSYAEALPLLGVAAASFGSIGDTLHTDNTRWAIGLCDALAAGAQTVGELVARGAPASASASSSYRLIGDPMAPLSGTDQGIARAARVTTHP